MATVMHNMRLCRCDAQDKKAAITLQNIHQRQPKINKRRGAYGASHQDITILQKKFLPS
ncbi:hypothetical protein DPMN_011990 [Dreissena polymorpha]|uniref:Uncharacterized protein n=1 Tax=Dreissena polymorpha TaxID=45954 RepID=A0A9D4S2E6_DREPO|nr:hypothetical protein DPMN_011990 [Dreissena polymorpha]